MRAIALSAFCILAACGPSVSGGGDGGGDDDDGSCTAPSQRCSGTTLQSCSGGAWVDVTTCPDACDADLGCVVCQPGTGTCNGDTAHECKVDGSGYEDVYCDPIQGMSC